MINYFVDKEFQCRCHRSDCDAPKAPDPVLLSKLNYMRQLFNQPVIVNSGARCVTANKRAGGVADSAHLTAMAADVSCANSIDRYFMMAAAIEAGFSRIGIGKTFLHLDVDTSKPSQVIWLY